MMANESLIANNFLTHALVLLTPQEGGRKVNDVFDQTRSEISSTGATNMSVTDDTVCGRPAQTLSFTAPAIKGMQLGAPGQSGYRRRPGRGQNLCCDCRRACRDPANPTYQHDSDTILTGLQVLPPG